MVYKWIFVAAISLFVAIFRAVVMAPLPGLNDIAVNLSGKTAIVTGATDGIGKYSALALAKWNATVILPVRNLTKGERVKEWIEANIGSGKGSVELFKLDLSSFDSVRKFVDAFVETERPLHLLLNNAGTMTSVKAEDEGAIITADGIELIYQVNYLSPFLLTELLLPNLRSASASRIVHVSSAMHTKGKIDHDAYNSKNKNVIPGTCRLNYQTYQDTKLMQVVYSKELASRLQGTGIVSNSVHPGAVISNLDNHKAPGWKELAQVFKKLFGRSTPEGAITQLIASVDPRLGNVSGKYLSDRCVSNLCQSCFFCGEDGEFVHPAVANVSEQQWLHRTSRAIVGL